MSLLSSCDCCKSVQASDSVLISSAYSDLTLVTHSGLVFDQEERYKKTKTEEFLVRDRNLSNA